MLKANVHAIIISQANMAQEYSHHICRCEYSQDTASSNCRIIRESNQPTSSSTQGRGTKLVPSKLRDLGSSLRLNLGIMRDRGACQHWQSSGFTCSWLGIPGVCSRFLHTIANKPSLVWCPDHRPDYRDLEGVLSLIGSSGIFRQERHIEKWVLSVRRRQRPQKFAHV